MSQQPIFSEGPFGIDIAATVADLPGGASTGKFLGYTGGKATWLSFDSDLTSLSDLSTTGLAVRSGSGTWLTRSLAAPAAGFTITNPDGVSGAPTFALANDLAAVEGLSSNGFATRTADGTWTTRSLSAPASGLVISNPDGVSGAPAFSLANDLAALEALSGNGIAARTGTDTWAVRTFQGTSGWITITNPDGVSGNPTFNVGSNVARALIPTPPKTSNYSAAVGDAVGLNASGGGFTVSFPSSPTNGDRIGWFLAATHPSNVVTWNGNGNNVQKSDNTGFASTTTQSQVTLSCGIWMFVSGLGWTRSPS